MSRTGAGRRGPVSPAGLTRVSILALAVVLAAAPFLWMLLSSVKTSAEIAAFPPTFVPSEWVWENYATVFERAPFLLYYGNSLLTTATATLGQVLTSLMAGYAFARLQFPGSRIIFGILLTALLVPFELVFNPLVDLLSGLGWTNTYEGLIIPNIPSILGVFLFRQFFVNLSTEIEEAASLDGAGVWRRFWTIVTPMAMPMIGAFTILSFTYNWNNFFFQLVVVTKSELFTVQLGLAMFRTADSASGFNVLMAASTLAIVPVLVVYLVLQKQILNAVSGQLR
ncbi:carbohydrate ABC transporter permease [Microbacterium sp. 1.5R]|uniref:carbohydrate ABC transporter permease n=1 Tax=Microbacterium sp. 1.5R TaxID=1916917 RepID=UPI0011AA87B0|nr:carbohydrate ABC transporter permease [Microbacterium sp. 1.5R]